MMDKIKDRLVKNDKGFTLIEALITLALFSVVVLIATNIYMSVISIQTRVVSLQKIQEDVRFLMESMTQSVRLGYIDYIFYNANSRNLYPGASNIYELAVIDQTGNRIFYRRSGSLTPDDGSGGELQFCTGTNCDLLSGDWQDITPKGVKVTDLKFIITPSADPFTEVASQLTACTLGSTCSAPYNFYRCKDNTPNLPSATCQYYSDDKKFQPKVKIIIKTESSGERMAERASIHLQTTISTRIPQFEVKNTYHD